MTGHVFSPVLQQSTQVILVSTLKDSVNKQPRALYLMSKGILADKFSIHAMSRHHRELGISHLNSKVACSTLSTDVYHWCHLKVPFAFHLELSRQGLSDTVQCSSDVLTFTDNFE